MIPNELKPLFWDVDTAGFDPTVYPDYTIFSVLEFGDAVAGKWLRAAFGDDEIRRALRTEQRLSPKSATFWALVYQVPAHEVAALAGQKVPLALTQ